MAEVIVHSSLSVKASALAVPCQILEKASYITKTEIIIKSKFFSNDLQTVTADKCQSSPHGEIYLEKFLLCKRRLIFRHIYRHCGYRHQSGNKAHSMHRLSSSAGIVAAHSLPFPAAFLAWIAVKMCNTFRKAKHRRYLIKQSFYLFRFRFFIYYLCKRCKLFIQFIKLIFNFRIHQYSPFSFCYLSVQKTSRYLWKTLKKQ